MSAVIGKHVPLLPGCTPLSHCWRVSGTLTRCRLPCAICCQHHCNTLRKVAGSFGDQVNGRCFRCKHCVWPLNAGCGCSSSSLCCRQRSVHAVLLRRQRGLGLPLRHGAVLCLRCRLLRSSATCCAGLGRCVSCRVPLFGRQVGYDT